MWTSCVSSKSSVLGSLISSLGAHNEPYLGGRLRGHSVIQASSLLAFGSMQTSGTVHRCGRLQPNASRASFGWDRRQPSGLVVAGRYRALLACAPSELIASSRQVVA